MKKRKAILIGLLIFDKVRYTIYKIQLCDIYNIQNYEIFRKYK